MAKEYDVIRILPLSRVSDLGGIEPYYRHTIKTKGGVVLNVDIDDKDFTPEKVNPILTKAAQNADTILHL